MSKILTLSATGLAGLVLGAGIGVAAASGGQTDRPVERPPAETEGPAPIMDMSTMDPGSMTRGSMEEMHAEMRDVMPAEMLEQCDEMHSQMGQHMSSGDGAGPMGGGDPAAHAEHHPVTKD